MNFNLVFLETVHFSWKPFKLAKSAKSSILGLLSHSFVLNAWFSMWPRKCHHDLFFWSTKIWRTYSIHRYLNSILLAHVTWLSRTLTWSNDGAIRHPRARNLLLRFPAHGKMYKIYLETLILNWTKSPQTETWEMQIDNFTTIQENNPKKAFNFMRKKSANISKNSQISAKIRKSGFLHFLVFQDFPDFILISGWGLYLRQMLGLINRSMWICCWDWTGLEFGFEPAAFRIYICTVSACCCIAILKGSSHDWKCPRTARKKETVALGRWDMLVATFPFNFLLETFSFPPNRSNRTNR